MKPLSADTTPEIQLKHYEMMRRLSPGRRLKLAFDLTETMRILILADIHYWNPDADEATLQAFGFDPETEDR
jgi:hypothetical protein